MSNFAERMREKNKNAIEVINSTNVEKWLEEQRTRIENEIKPSVLEQFEGLAEKGSLYYFNLIRRFDTGNVNTHEAAEALERILKEIFDAEGIEIKVEKKISRVEVEFCIIEKNE